MTINGSVSMASTFIQPGVSRWEVMLKKLPFFQGRFYFSIFLNFFLKTVYFWGHRASLRKDRARNLINHSISVSVHQVSMERFHIDMMKLSWFSRKEMRYPGLHQPARTAALCDRKCNCSQVGCHCPCFSVSNSTCNVFSSNFYYPTYPQSWRKLQKQAKRKV